MMNGVKTDTTNDKIAVKTASMSWKIIDMTSFLCLLSNWHRKYYSIIKNHLAFDFQMVLGEGHIDSPTHT